jgi:hypothetical protein
MLLIVRTGVNLQPRVKYVVVHGHEWRAGPGIYKKYRQCSYNINFQHFVLCLYLLGCSKSITQLNSKMGVFIRAAEAAPILGGRTDGHTDRHKKMNVIGAFREYVKAHKIVTT